MRMIEVFHEFGLGGAEVATITRLSHSPSHISSTVVAGSFHPEMSRRLRELNVQSEELGAQSRLNFIGGGHRVDAVLIHNPREVIRFLRPRVQSRIAPPAIVIAHNTRPYVTRLGKLVNPPALRILNPRAAGHIAVSSEVAKSDWCRGSRRTIVQHLGADVPTGSSVEQTDYWPSGVHIRALAIGRLVPYKGFLELLRAVKEKERLLRSESFHLAIVGSGSEEERLANEIARQRIHDLVSLHPGFVGAAELMRWCDVFIISSSHEGGPLTLYEALSLGRPVISTPVGACIDFSDFVPTLHLTHDFGYLALAQQIEMFVEGSQEEESKTPETITALDPRYCAEGFYKAVSKILTGNA